MTEIRIRVPKAMAHLIEQLVNFIPEMEIVESVEDLQSETDRDYCVRKAIETLLSNEVIRYPRDYAWIMFGLEQGVVREITNVGSQQDFIDYLKRLGFDAPSRSTLYNGYSNIDGIYPNWEFLDNPTLKEQVRRRNVFVQFLSAFEKAKRDFCKDS